MGAHRVLLVILLTSGFIISTAQGANDMDPRRVSVLYIGDPYASITPYRAMVEDAFISVLPIRAWHAVVPLETVYRYMRMYMPRSYQRFVEGYDVLILSDAYRWSFTSSQHYWLRDGVIDQGMGLLMVGGKNSFFASSGHPSANWKGAPVEDVLPIVIPVGPAIEHNWIRKRTKKVVGHGNEFIASLPFTPKPKYMTIPTDGQLVEEREGSDVLLRWIYPELGDPPLYATMDIGEGRTFAMTHDWSGERGDPGGYYFARWEYYTDYAINLMLYLTKRPLPTDHLVVHQYREEVSLIALGKGMLLSLVEFIDKFGASTRRLDDEMTIMDSMVSDAAQSYLDHDFEEALGRARSALEKQEEIEKLSVVIKNQTLFWVYVVEWMSVTGVGLLAGILLWSLMVRRRLYRDVRATRLPRLEADM
jgi:uncharacterized membrane protein